jgi:hypothetical protein
MGKKKEPEPMGGEKDIEKKLAAGLDPNADLDGDADTKAQAGLTLKLKGASWSDIARVLEYSSPTQARTAVERALATASNSPESIEQMRTLQRKRYDRLLLAVMGKALKEDDPNQLAYHARAVAVVDRISALDGLNAAQQVQVTASDETIQAYVANMAKLAGFNTKAIEGEILDADVIEGEF